MQEERFKYLIKKYLNNSIDPQELREFFASLDQYEHLLEQEIDQEDILPVDDGFLSQPAFEKLVQSERFKSSRKIRRINLYRLVGVAACVVFILGISLYRWTNQPLDSVFTQKDPTSENVISVPAENRAGSIRLADGTQLELEDIEHQQVNYDGVLLSKDEDNLIKISLVPAVNPKANEFHEFSTKRGVSYSLLLPDGTKVHLNSGSHLKLSAGFNLSNRDCELIGEAYFDVTHNKEKIFSVKTSDQLIQVFGTQFNIKSYPTSAGSKTSLVEGLVRVSAKGTELQLIPGEQANISSLGVLGKDKTNLREVLAWREGYFRFSNLGIKEIMKDIMNWYAIDQVVYESNTNEFFTGSIQRSRSLGDVLAGIEKISNLKFEIRERRVFVRN